LSAQLFIYLHGFASGPSSTKAIYLQQRFQACQQSLLLPDLNQDDFYHLSLTRQLQQVAALLPTSPVYLIGSSFGGLTAAWLGQTYPQVKGLLLLAPAFEFMEVWVLRLGQQLEQWQTQGYLPFYHYGQRRYCNLEYGFVRDLHGYHDRELQRPISTTILHGQRDEVIPIQVSRRYAEARSWVTLQELDSDHSLMDCCDQIWRVAQTWLDEASGQQ
jgi:uncharacterized protein